LLTTDFINDIESKIETMEQLSNLINTFDLSPSIPLSFQGEGEV